MSFGDERDESGPTHDDLLRAITRLKKVVRAAQSCAAMTPEWRDRATSALRDAPWPEVSE